MKTELNSQAQIVFLLFVKPRKNLLKLASVGNLGRFYNRLGWNTLLEDELNERGNCPQSDNKGDGKEKVFFFFNLLFTQSICTLEYLQRVFGS